MKKKKILFLSPLPPPYYGAAISSEMCLAILNKSKSFDVKNIKLNYSRAMSDIGKINFDKITGIGKVKKQIISQIRYFNPDIVYVMPATSSLGLIRDYFFVKQIKKHWKGKILFHIRSRINYKDWKNPLFRNIYKRMFQNGIAIVLDKKLKKDLHRIIPDKDIFILPNAIKNELSGIAFSKIVKNRKNTLGNNLLFLSNMDESKGWLKLLQACKILKDHKIDFKCNFVGAWPKKREKRKFYSFITENKLQNNVKYLGKKIGKEKNKLLEKANMLIFPTEYKLETFGRVVIEGMMFGLPIIANGIAAIPTTIQDKNTGFILKRNTPKEIANKIDILLKNGKLRENMGKLGRKRFLKYYTQKSYEEKFLNILSK